MSSFFSEHGQAGPPVRPTPARTPLPKRTVLPAPKAPRRVSLNPMQQAQLNVRRELAPQYSAVDQEAARQNQAIQSYTAAVMQQLAGLAPQIQGDYNNAINAQQGMVDAAANSLRSVNPSGDVARLLDAVGAPAAQGQQIQGNLNNTFNGGAAVGQYVNGVSPLGALRSQGEAATTLARLQPSFQALAGRQALISALANQADARAKIAAQAPTMIQDQLNTFTSNAAKRQQLGLEAQSLGLKTQNQAFNQNLAVGKQNFAVDKFNAQQALALQKQGLAVTKFNASQSATQNKIDVQVSRGFSDGFAHNSQGGVIRVNGAPLKFNAKTASVRSSAAPKKIPAFPNLSKSEVLHLRSGIANAFYGVPGTSKNPQGAPPLSYQAAIQRAMQSGYSRADAVKMANAFYRMNQKQVKKYYGGTLPNVNPATNPKAAGPVK